MPEDLSGLQVDRDHLAPGRLVAQQAERRHRHRARHRKRRPLLLAEIMAGRRIEARGLRARNQFHHMHGVAGIGIEDLVDGIERRAAPIDAAAGHRKNERALRRRRRVEALVARTRKLLLARRTAEEPERVIDGPA